MGVHEAETARLEQAVKLSKLNESTCIQQLEQLEARTQLPPAYSTAMQRADEEFQQAIEQGRLIAQQVREVPMRAPQGCPTNKIVQVNGVSVYSSAVSCIEQNEVFCARDDEGRQIVVFVDDGSEVTLLRKSMASKHWARSKDELINITGIGADNTPKQPRSKKDVYSVKNGCKKVRIPPFLTSIPTFSTHYTYVLRGLTWVFDHYTSVFDLFA